MRLAVAPAWRRRAQFVSLPDFADRVGAVAAVMLLIAMTASAVVESTTESDRGSQASRGQQLVSPAFRDKETAVSFYLAQPFYRRSDVRMTRNDGTDLHLKQLGWDGDMLYPPIDGGVRSVTWSGATGFMIDFLHNKAVSRLGKGAHGSRKGSRPIETVDAAGTLKGRPAPARIKLTDLFERFEFTHGHNVLIFNAMARLGRLTPRIRPYVGAGAGFALPHVEVWFEGEQRENRTNEYQFAGPAAQLVAGLELRTGKVSYYLEYKFSWASIRGALTGDESWKNFNMPGDLLRQVLRWWRGEAPRFGSFSTTLTAHQGVFGAGYVLQGKAGPSGGR